MDFLLECIGFSPDWDLAKVARLVAERGEPTPWRGRPSEHLSMPLAGGLELRLDREPGLAPSVWPFYSSGLRRRVAVRELQRVEDSPGDVVLVGRANPRAAAFAPDDLDEEHDLACYLTDGRRLPPSVAAGQVLAVVLAGFGLQIEYVGPNDASPGRMGFPTDGHPAAPPADLVDPTNGALADVPTTPLGEPLIAPDGESPIEPVSEPVSEPSIEPPGEPPIDSFSDPFSEPSHAPAEPPTARRPSPPAALDAAVDALLRNVEAPPPTPSPPRRDVLDAPRGAAFELLGGPDSPAAAMQISARIRTVSHLTNKLTGRAVHRIELDAPGLPIEVFVSPWQLAADGLPPPRPGWRIEGVFLMLGRNVGAVPGRRRGPAFG